MSVGPIDQAELTVTGAPDHRARLMTAFALAGPLIVFFLIQNAVTLVSLAIMGRLGTTALAGVGIASAVYGMLLALLYGFDTGVQAVVARAIGAGDTGRAGQALGDALCVSAPFAAMLAMVAFLFGPAMVHTLTPDPATAMAATAFLRGEAASIFFLGITIPFNSYWIGSAQPRISFLVTALLAPVQIAITWPLVFGAGAVPPLGITGAGIAVALATIAALILQITIARLRKVALFRHPPRWSGVATILRIGWPVSLQQSFLQVGLIIAFAIVSRLGVAEVAALNVLNSLMLIPIMASTGMGIACGTLVGQALGRGDLRDAARWGWQMSFAAAAIMLPLGTAVALQPRLVLGLFLIDPTSIALATVPAQLLGASAAIDVFVRVLGFALRGAGATRSATGIAFVAQWLLQLPLIWWVGVHLQFGLTGIVVTQVGLTCLEAAAYALVWQRERWTTVQIAGLHLPGATPVSVGVIAPWTRIAVLGGAGAGKSTLTRALGAQLGLPMIHLDRLVYGPNWTRRRGEAVRADLAEAMRGGCWVVDGTYPGLNDLVLGDADLVIWIEQPALRRLFRTWRKTQIYRSGPRTDRPDGCEEGFSLNYAWTIFRFGRWTPVIERELRQARGEVIRLRGDSAVATFLENSRRR